MNTKSNWKKILVDMSICCKVTMDTTIKIQEKIRKQDLKEQLKDILIVISEFNINDDLCGNAELFRLESRIRRKFK